MFFSFGTRRHALGTVGDTTGLSHTIAIETQFGPGAFAFVTITPDDINNPTSFKLSMRRVSNKSFPSLAFPQFFEDLKKKSDPIFTDPQLNTRRNQHPN